LIAAETTSSQAQATQLKTSWYVHTAWMRLSQWQQVLTKVPLNNGQPCFNCVNGVV